uniref:Ig-like domain-containing protein n=1 Tax=Sphaeramia orbicularis TaxID=375764 RepID=A0A672ZNT6_9TELE
SVMRLTASPSSRIVHLGEPAIFTCVLPPNEISVTEVHWYKQTVGKNLKLIVKLKKNIEPTYGPQFSESRVFVHIDKNYSNLTILRTTPEDEGLYHCGVLDYITNTWSGTYLSLTNYTVVQRPTVSDPLHPGDSMSLQCSVLSDSDNKTCPGDHSVYWVRVGSHESDPGIIYTEGNRQDGCNDRPDTQSSPKSCLHHFSKTVNSSDAGTYYYYCAVATCGRILFGNGTRIQIGMFLLRSERGNTVIFYNIDSPWMETLGLCSVNDRFC